MIDAQRLQRNLSVRDDGVIGRDTPRALFARFGAAPSLEPELGLYLENNPQIVSIASIGLLCATAYWDSRGLENGDTHTFLCREPWTGSALNARA